MDFVPIFVLFFQSISTSGNRSVSRYPVPLQNETRGGICGYNYANIALPPRPPAAAQDQPPVSPSDFVPFKILFLIDDTISQAIKAKLEKATRYAQETLEKIVKAPRLDDVRFRQDSVTPTSCPQLVCDSSSIPTEYLKQCPANPEPNIPAQPTGEIIRKNSENYTLVMLVVVNGDGNGFGGAIACPRSELQAYAGGCILSLDNQRATHGRLVYCKDPSVTPDEKLADTTLHESLHVLLPTLFASTDPVHKCHMPGDTSLTDGTTRCKDKLWKQVDRQWMNEAGAIETRPSFIAIADPFPKVAKEYFGCDSVEGFQLAYSLDSQGKPTVDQPDFGHWSNRLFPEELLAPRDVVSPRLSILTLTALAAHTSWYIVDSSYAEPLVVSKPAQEFACAVNEKSCWEILRGEKGKGGAKSLAPYCDDKPGSDRIISSRCSKDHKMSTLCTANTEDCPVLFPKEGEGYDHAVCEKASEPARGSWPVLLGAGAGEGTTCVTFTYCPFLVDNYLTLSACVLYECRLSPPTIVLKFQPENAAAGECFVECAAGMSNQIMNVTKQPVCVGGHSKPYSIICPDYNEICVPPTTTTSKATDAGGSPGPGGSTTELASATTSPPMSVLCVALGFLISVFCCALSPCSI